MSESIKINMPFDKWCKIQKDFEELNSKLPEDKKLDFENINIATTGVDYLLTYIV